MSEQPVTLRDSLSGRADGESDGNPVPGVLHIFSAGEPRCVSMPIPASGSLELGRGDGKSAMPADPRMSRRHASVSFDGQRFRVSDHGSQNGTYVDGAKVQSVQQSAAAKVLRTGDSLFLFCGDLRPFERLGVQVNSDRVIGPSTFATTNGILRRTAREEHLR